MASGFAKVLGIVSLLLCAATVVLWGRSFWVADDLRWSHIKSTNSVTTFQWYTMETNRGRLYFYDNHFGLDGLAARLTLPVFTNEDSTGYRKFPAQALPGESLRTQFAFKYGKSKGEEHVVLPMGWVLMFFVFISALVLPGTVRRRRERIRSAQGRCVVCGYDLSATPERCPECGAIPANGLANSTEPTPNQL